MTGMASIAVKIIQRAGELNAALCILESNQEAGLLGFAILKGEQAKYPNHLTYLDNLPTQELMWGSLVLALQNNAKILAIQEDQKKDRSWFRYWVVTKEGEFIEQPEKKPMEKPPREPVVPLNEDLAMELHRIGCPDRAMCRLTGVKSDLTIRRWRRKHGLPRNVPPGFLRGDKWEEIHSTEVAEILARYGRQL